jgi:hypothetical protein
MPTKWKPIHITLLPRRINSDRSEKYMTQASEFIYELLENFQKNQSREIYEETNEL